MTALQIIRGQPYLTVKQIAEATGRVERTVRNKIAGIRKEIEHGRYSPYALPEGLVSWYVYVDYLTYEKRLEDKNLRKTVPDFNPAEIEKLSGFRTKFIDLGE
jgi:predicted transcriptional regulator